MKKYVQESSKDRQLIQDIRREINSYVEEYYNAWGYDKREYSIPKCHIKEEKFHDGEVVYKMSVDMDIFDEYNTDTICKNLNDAVNFYAYPEYDLYQEFILVGDSTFIGYIKKIETEE